MKTLLLSRSSRASNGGEAALYKNLMAAYVSLSGNTPGQVIGEGRNDFNIEGMDFSLAYLPRVNPQALQISASILRITPEQEADFYFKMLSINLHLHRQTSAVLALSPDTPMVLALLRLSLRQVTPSTLDQILKGMARTVTEWRTELLA